MQQIFRWTILLLILLPTLAYADWMLVPEASTLAFVSVKNGAVVESHRFEGISGSISTAGDVKITIDLTSVNTLIPIRNERMQKHLFQTQTFPVAIVASKIVPREFTSMPLGSSRASHIEFQLNFHGQKASMTADITILKAREGVFQVTSDQPVILHSSQFALTAGIEALRLLAKLQSITPAVPVTFNLVFKALPIRE